MARISSPFPFYPEENILRGGLEGCKTPPAANAGHNTGLNVDPAYGDPGELFSLDALGIVSIALDRTALNHVTPQGTRLEGVAEFTWSTGGTGRMFDAVFEMNDVDTRVDGEAGIAPWLRVGGLDARGGGQVADLGIAMSNDFDLARMAAEAAPAMTTPDLRDMRAKSAAALGQWGYTLDQTRELVPVLLDDEGALLNRAVWTEDTAGGWWGLESGQPVLDPIGAVIERPVMGDVLAQPGGWRLEQVFSPSTRAEPLRYREPLLYLVEVVEGRAVILDHARPDAGGVWRLASGAAIADADGHPIPDPTGQDILGQPRTPTRGWHEEALGHNPLAALPVSGIGVYQVDGRVVDYTVLVTDNLGSFHVWARTLDQALAVQALRGNAFGYDLRAHAVDFAALDIVDSEEDSIYRVEVLTPGQLNFATELSGITFNPAMLMATLDRAAGVIGYSVNSAIATVNKLMLLSAGRVAQFGPRDEVLAQVQKRPAIVAGAGHG